MLAGVILGVALGADRICAARSDRLSSVETWAFNDENAEAPLGERVVTVIGVMQVRALRESVAIGLIKIACPDSQASLLRADQHLVGVGEIEFVDALAAQWAGTQSATKYSPTGEVALIDIGASSMVARIVDVTGNMRIVGERTVDSFARDRSITAELGTLLSNVANASTSKPEKTFVSGEAADESAVNQAQGPLPVQFVGDATALAAQGAIELGAKKVASTGPRHSARHAAKPVAKKKRWYR
jgi:hypothetical protein